MIDFLLGVIVGALGLYATLHFSGTDPAKTLPTFLSSLDQRINRLMSQAADDLAAKISALPAELEAKFAPQITDLQATVTDLQGQLDTEKADHASDLQKLSDAVAAITPAG